LHCLQQACRENTSSGDHRDPSFPMSVRTGAKTIDGMDGCVDLNPEISARLSLTL
jgi:hypothetical protein